MPPLVVTNRMDPVDLALCLAVDVSASVDYDEFGLMVGGYAAAFREPGIIAACTAGKNLVDETSARSAITENHDPPSATP